MFRSTYTPTPLAALPTFGGSRVLPAAVFLIVDGVQDVDGPLHTPDLIERLVHAVLARVRAQPMNDS